MAQTEIQCADLKRDQIVRVRFKPRPYGVDGSWRDVFWSVDWNDDQTAVLRAVANHYESKFVRLFDANEVTFWSADELFAAFKEAAL